MAANGRQSTQLATVAVVALLALGIVPVLAASASAAPVGPATSHAAAGEWAYGGTASRSYTLSMGRLHYALGAAAEGDVIYNATNTTYGVTELTATRTVVITVNESLSGPVSSWSFHLQLAEDDHAYANVTNASSVTLGNGSVVPALGLMNTSFHGDVSLAASLHGSTANASVSDYLNASGSADAAVQFTPALGLIPLNLTGVSTWHASALAAGSAAWAINWSWVDHGWNGTGSNNGTISGSWSASTVVEAFGQVGPAYGFWHDHRPRTAVGLSLSGPFDLYGGFLLVPHGFDLFAAGGGSIAGKGLGASAITSEYVFVGRGRVGARSITAANMTTSGSPPAAPAVTSAFGGAAPAVTPSAASGPGTTVWEQPESPQAAQAQASCMQYGLGCGHGKHPLGAVLVVLGIGGAVAIVAVALVLTRRRPAAPAPLNPARADVPLGATGVATPALPTPPTGGPSAFGPTPPSP